MKKSTSFAGQHGLNLQSRNTSTSFMDESSGDTLESKRIKLEGQGQMEEQNSNGVPTIGALSTVTQEIILLPPEVLRIILLNLEKRDLLQNRRVNSLWRASTSKILRGRDDEIVFDPSRASLLSLSTILNCLTRTKDLNCLDQFPCTRFKFSLINLNAKVTGNFFNLYGPVIKTLKLLFCKSHAKKDGQLSTLAQLLIRQAANIEDLEIFGLDIVLPTSEYDGEIRLFPPINEVKLSALKKLSIYFRCAKRNRIVEEILGTAVYLECFDLCWNYDQNILDKLVSLNKFHTIKRANVELLDHLGFWEHFANLGPNLHCVRFHLNSLHILTQNRLDFNLMKRITTVIQKILESSRHTLERIDYMQPLGFLPGFQMPVLSQLKEVTVNNLTNWIMESVFPRGLSLATVFPNVENVNMTLGQHRASDADFWVTFFPHINLMDNTWPSVRSLKVSDIPPASMDNISRLFPNVKMLTVVRVADFSLSCRAIFACMKQLESLAFEVVYCHLYENKYPAMESAFTGFSHEACLRLAQSDESLDDVDVQNLRENVSILELKNLTRLKLTGIQNCESLVLTRVSGIFAFQLMPRLRVTVEIRDWPNMRNPCKNAALKAMAPFVHSAK